MLILRLCFDFAETVGHILANSHRSGSEDLERFFSAAVQTTIDQYIRRVNIYMY